MSTGTKGRRQANHRQRQREVRRKPSDKAPLLSLRPEHPGRFQFVVLILFLAVVAILGKLFYIQVIDAEHLKRKAQLSRNQALTLFKRGRILDRNGAILAQDTILYDLFAHPDYFFKTPKDKIAEALAPAINMDTGKLRAQLEKPYSTIALQKNLTKQDIEKIAAVRMRVPAFNEKTAQPILDPEGNPMIREKPLPGMDFSKKTVRNYPQGNLAAHVLGYVNDEADISSGVEATAAHILKKKPLELSRTVLDGRGNLIELEQVDPRHIVELPKAQDIRLTIDARLQYIAERELAKGMEKSNAKRGTVIMMDPRSGELLAFAVLPTYQPDRFAHASYEQLKNWAITDVYPPGSTFKILTVASGLELGVINRNTRIMDTGKMKVGGWTISNYDYGKHGAPGSIDLVYLLMHSSNIASAQISLMMPKQKHYDLLRRIGIGAKTGIDLPGESAGIILPPSKWDVSTHATLGYGYGMAATPLQIASAVAAIANGGIWHTPHVIKNSSIKQRRIFSEKTCATMRELLTASIRDAKTSTVRLSSVEVAGKTGTSRKPNENGRGYSPDLYTSFVGFFPAEAPKVLIMVVVDSPRMAEAWGSTVAGPIFKNIAEETVGYLGLMPAKMAMKTPATATETPSVSPTPARAR